MKRYEYKVELDTELGKRSGTMQLCVHGTRIEGFLSLLRHTEPLCGQINADGNCMLEGKIVTLLKEIAYKATGRIRRDTLLLKLRLGTSDCTLSGIAKDIAEDLKNERSPLHARTANRRKAAL